jgi:uncharacterized protein (DUF1810 family)
MADFSRFVDAQDQVYEAVLEELEAGRKRSHWMWFIFPQLRDLGRSSTAKLFGIAEMAEARAYFEHDVLGTRLLTCTGLVNTHAGTSAYDIFGSPDDLKFRSSMTLFATVAPDEPLFSTALREFYDGEPDPLTLRLLAQSPRGD